MDDARFKQWLESVIICTEQEYDPTVLDTIAKRPHTLKYADQYDKLLYTVIEELLE